MRLVLLGAPGAGVKSHPSSNSNDRENVNDNP